MANNEALVVVEALERVGMVQSYNHDEMTASVEAGFSILDRSGKTGIPYPWLPERMVTLADVVRALDSGQYAEGKQYPDTQVDTRLWEPGEGPDGYVGYSQGDFANFEAGRPSKNVPAHMRLAVGGDSAEAPLLHFVGSTFDEHRVQDGEEMQLTAVADAKQEYEESRNNFTMVPLNAKGLAMIALIQRIKGEDMPIEGFVMRDATMRRHTLKGLGMVGDVRSVNGGLAFGASFGFATSSHPLEAGVGLSVGPARQRYTQLPSSLL